MVLPPFFGDTPAFGVATDRKKPAVAMGVLAHGEDPNRHGHQADELPRHTTAIHLQILEGVGGGGR